MKCISVFFLLTAASFAQDWTTGQAARLVIGQETFTSQQEYPTESVFGGVAGVAWANDYLFVADSNRAGAATSNNRVLIFPGISATLPLPADQLEFTRKCPVCLGSASVVLGQPDFVTGLYTGPASKSTMRAPAAVASDGRHLVVADTDHNRVLIYNTIPTDNYAPADVVVGQANFTSSSLPGLAPTAKSLRGPQGVWIQNGKLYIADTQNHRVLIYNQIPTTNGVAADLVLGQPNFTAYSEPTIDEGEEEATAMNMLNPTSVTSDGTHLFVSDLGHHRVLIWNSLPTTNQQAADLELGQPDFTTGVPNNSYELVTTITESGSTRTRNDVYTSVLCTTTGTSAKGYAIFPDRCNATLSFPRFAFSDGTRLLVSDGGNDRVLIWNTIPTKNAQAADILLGQIGGDVNQASDAADSLRAPAGMAWDGSNLYVADAYNRRVVVYTIGENRLPYGQVRNSASEVVYAQATVTVGGSIQVGDQLNVTIGYNSASTTNVGLTTATVTTDNTTTTTVTSSTTDACTTSNCTDYKYKVVKDDDLASVTQAIANLINANDGNTYVIAYADTATYAVILKSRTAGADGDNITLATSTSSGAKITGSTSGANLTGGQDASQVAPGTLVTISGDNLSDTIASADMTQDPLPTELGRVQVYFNGIRAPLTYVSPGQIKAQIPFEFTDTTSISAYVRTLYADGNVRVTTPMAVTIVKQNPGIFTIPSSDPVQAIMVHGSSSATGTISVDGSIHAGDIAKVTIEDRTYTYVVQTGDTKTSIRDALILLINKDPRVEAYASGSFDRIRLRARIEGPDGNGIKIAASASDGSSVIMTATNSTLCCANVAGTTVNDDNPAVPGETVIVYATGLGMLTLNDDNKQYIKTGYQYLGPAGAFNDPAEFVYAMAGGKTANLLFAGLQYGAVGIYQVEMELNSSLVTNPYTTLTIAQDKYVSNIVTFPVVNPTQTTSSSAVFRSSKVNGH
jgi:uncharacterized protein (TIGR03437 family)